MLHFFSNFVTGKKGIFLRDNREKSAHARSPLRAKNKNGLLFFFFFFEQQRARRLQLESRRDLVLFAGEESFATDGVDEFGNEEE